MPRKERKSLKVSEKCFEQLTYLCRVMNLSKTAFLSELIDQLFEIGAVYKSLNLSYTIFGENLDIAFSGRSRIVSGSFVSPNSESDAKTEAKVVLESKKALEKLESD